MITYFFYKNMVFTTPHFFYAFINGYSAQPVFDDFYITFYNMVFTALPLLIRALFEQDVNYKERDFVNGELKSTERPFVKQYFHKLYYIG
mmetsp:Transcript_2644/g.2283  ORF Transcript_2644/g.2283 Transcript_2644/m.2283 type:complete len:90 (+) Transcript_2644:499-768(+)